ncbi:hypothetical protein B0H19DRAFT_1349894 [Mycena capillaripes]|nr:hypothetical protein B0H19DRAFT_1349894 [Mycena capillaripes]
MGASEINFGPENWTRNCTIFDLADQPLYFRSKEPVFFTSFSLPNPHHLPPYRKASPLRMCGFCNKLVQFVPVLALQLSVQVVPKKILILRIIPNAPIFWLCILRYWVAIQNNRCIPIARRKPTIPSAHGFFLCSPRADIRRSNQRSLSSLCEAYRVRIVVNVQVDSPPPRVGCRHLLYFYSMFAYFYHAIRSECIPNTSGVLDFPRKMRCAFGAWFTCWHAYGRRLDLFSLEPLRPRSMPTYTPQFFLEFSTKCSRSRPTFKRFDGNGT